VGVGSVAVIGRTPVDAAVSLATGRDCSAVRLDRGLGYCRPAGTAASAATLLHPQPRPCGLLARTAAGLPVQRGVADGPATLTAEQEAHRTRRWPGLF
jgi:hypothetical protein